jgi:hypothetical protein
MAANRSRLYSGVPLAVAATATVLLAAACSGTATVAANGSTATAQWSATQTTPAASSGTAKGGETPQPSTAASAAQQKLQFPNTSFTASINSYDAATQMVTFDVVKFVPGGADNGSFAQDPSKPGHYRLPLAASMQIKAVLSLCPGISEPSASGVSCTKQQFVQALQNGQGGIADLHVDASDHIDAVSERYHP